MAAWPSIEKELRGRRLSVFLDFDGTLTPVVPRPTGAYLDARTRDTVRRLATRWPVQVISGRRAADVRARLGIDSLWTAGNHGFEILPPAGTPGGLEVASELVPEIHRAAGELRRETACISGAEVEDKAFTLGVHYRLVDPALVPEVERAVDRVAARHPALRRTPGKKVFQLQPALDWDKGKALRWILSHTGQRDAFPLYFGDDATDETALAAVADDGLGVRVAEHPRPTAARYSLQNSDEVAAFLERLVSLGGAQR